MPNAQLVGEVVKEYLKEFPDLPSLTLARLILKENPALFTSIDTARARVRYYRGQLGSLNRRDLGVHTFVKPAGSVCPFDDLPEGLTDFHEWKPFHLEGEHTLLLADVHIPYHDTLALKTALQYGKEKDVDTIFLNGDFMDFYAVSTFEKDPRKRNFKREIDTTIQVLSIIRREFPKARIYFKLGNHEERYERFMKIKAPELLGMKQFELSSLINADEFGIHIIGEKRICKIGKLFVVHGHEFGKSVFAPVNPARGLYMRGKENAIGSHHHQVSHHTEKTMSNGIISTWTTGCLCDLHPEYQVINNWSHGFAIISVDTNGEFHVDNKKIINGKTY